MMMMTADMFLLVVLAEVTHVHLMLQHPHRAAHVGPPKPPPTQCHIAHLHNVRHNCFQPLWPVRLGWETLGSRCSVEELLCGKHVFSSWVEW